MHFRPAAEHEAASLTSLEREASLKALGHVFPPQQYPYPTDEVQQRWERLLGDDAVRVDVIEDAAGIAAFVAFDNSLLRHLAVRPDRWRSGLARAAIEWALTQAPVERLWCLEANTQALGLYGHLGWRRTGRGREAEFPPYPREVELSIR